MQWNRQRDEAYFQERRYTEAKPSRLSRLVRTDGMEMHVMSLYLQYIQIIYLNGLFLQIFIPVLNAYIVLSTNYSNKTVEGKQFLGLGEHE